MRSVSPPAPASALPAERRGPVVGCFCHGCSSVYPRFARRHAGKPAFGRDHLASTCPYEGRDFAEGAAWWEPAVEPLASSAAS